MKGTRISVYFIMPFSLLLLGYPTSNVPVAHVQRPALQGMFLRLINEGEPATAERLHHEADYRPYRLSPLGIGASSANEFATFRIPRHEFLSRGTSGYVRITMLGDDLFLVFAGYFLDRNDPISRLGHTKLVVTDVKFKNEKCDRSSWPRDQTYEDLIHRASNTHRNIHCLNPPPHHHFQRGRIDLPMPIPGLVFQSVQRHFQQFHEFTCLNGFAEQVEFHTGVAKVTHLEPRLLKTNRVSRVGFFVPLTYHIHPRSPPELKHQMNLLADYAFFCGTGPKNHFWHGTNTAKFINNERSFNDC